MSDNVHTLSRFEFAEAAGVSADTVRDWLRNGKIPSAFKDEAGHWRVPEGATVLHSPQRGPRTQQPTVVVSTTPAAPAPSSEVVLHARPVDDEPEVKVDPVFGSVTTFDAIAKRLGVTRGTVEGMIEQGLLPGVEIKAGESGRARALYVPAPAPSGSF